MLRLKLKLMLKLMLKFGLKYCDLRAAVMIMLKLNLQSKLQFISLNFRLIITFWLAKGTITKLTLVTVIFILIPLFLLKSVCTFTLAN